MLKAHRLGRRCGHLRLSLIGGVGRRDDDRCHCRMYTALCGLVVGRHSWRSGAIQGVLFLGHVVLLSRADMVGSTARTGRFMEMYPCLYLVSTLPPFSAQSSQLPGYSPTFVQPASLANVAAALPRTPALQ